MGTLREDLESASSELGGDGADSSGEGSGPDVGAGDGGQAETTAIQSVASAPAGGETDATGAPSPTGRARDATGKFVKGESTPTKASKEVAPAPSSTGTPPPTPGGDSSQTPTPKQGEADSTSRPPPSWKHSAWGDWDKTPPAFRQEVWRREQEMQRYMEQHAPARQFVSELQQTLAPVLPALQARGTTPQRLIADYVRFDQQLASNDPSAKALAVAGVIKAYGVDIEALAEALDAKPRERAVDPAEIERRIRAEVEAKYEAQRTQAEMSNHVRQVQEFAKSPDATLFNDDIRFQMAALIDAAQARGVVLSLEDAYTQAVWANPVTRAIVQQQEQAKAQATAQAATQKAMAAGSSIKSRPASPVSGGGGRSIREDLEAAAAELSGR